MAAISIISSNITEILSLTWTNDKEEMWETIGKDQKELEDVGEREIKMEQKQRVRKRERERERENDKDKDREGKV